METAGDHVKTEFVSFLKVSAASILGGAALIGVRFALTGRSYYFFLLWNLILALVPYGISVAIYAVSRRERNSRTYTFLALLGIGWLVFYPNAPYIFTDFIHLVNRTWLRSGNPAIEKETLLWYDLVLCSVFAYIGHAAGLISMEIVFKSFAKSFNRWFARVFVAVAVLIAGFGLYVGRFVRFNSWDLFLDPLQTSGKILPHLLAPRTLLLGAAFSAFIFITFAIHYFFHKRYQDPRI